MSNMSKSEKTSNLSRYLSSSIGKKQIMAVTGLGLIGFLFTHLLGNLLILAGDGGDSYNIYAHSLVTNPFIIPAEIVLASLFLFHLFLAIKVTHENRSATPEGYKVDISAGGQTLMSKSMIYTGIWLLVFIILHLIHFKFSDKFTVVLNGTEMANFYRIVKETFQSFPYVIWYVASFAVMGLHIAHGFRSAFQTLGLNKKSWNCTLTLISYGLAVALFAGYTVIPVCLFFQKG